MKYLQRAFLKTTQTLQSEVMHGQTEAIENWRFLFFFICTSNISLSHRTNLRSSVGSYTSSNISQCRSKKTVMAVLLQNVPTSS